MKGLALVALTFVPASALAAVPLRALPPEVVQKIEPLAGRGELALIESKADGRLRQITIYTLVNAPPDKCDYVIAHPKEYPWFVPNVVKSELAGEIDGGKKGLFYSWELDVPLVNLKGISRMTYGDPPVASAGRRFHVETIAGDVPDGTWDWDFLPAPGGKTIIAYHGYADIRRSSWFLKKIIEHNKTIEHGAFLASGIVFVKSVKLRAEALAGRGDGKRPVMDMTAERNVQINTIKGTFDTQALIPLLERGQVALVESFHDGRLRQANLLSYVYVPEEKFYKILTTPAEFATFVPGLKKSQVVSDDGHTAVYDLEIKVPVLPNIEYTTKMLREPEHERVR